MKETPEDEQNITGNTEENKVTQEEPGSESPETSENAGQKNEDELSKLKAEVADARDKYLRVYSDFDNYRKRVSKERIDLIKSAGSEIIITMLPILDDFERARKSIETTNDLSAVKEGVELIYNKLKTTLEQKGLKEMETQGTVFDTDLHDALTNAPAPSEDMKGKVLDEVQKGYFLNDKVIRHAKVVIGQ